MIILNSTSKPFSWTTSLRHSRRNKDCAKSVWPYLTRKWAFGETGVSSIATASHAQPVTRCSESRTSSSQGSADRLFLELEWVWMKQLDKSCRTSEAKFQYQIFFFTFCRNWCRSLVQVQRHYRHRLLLGMLWTEPRIVPRMWRAHSWQSYPHQ